MIEPRRMENRINLRVMLFWVLLCSAAGLFTLALIHADGGITDWPLALGIIITIDAIILYAVPIRYEILLRPRSVEIVDSGLVLHQRLGRKPLHLPWEQITIINVYTDKPPSSASEYHTGEIWIYDKKCYTVSRDVALAARDAYWDTMGKYPPKGRPGQLVY